MRNRFSVGPLGIRRKRANVTFSLAFFVLTCFGIFFLPATAPADVDLLQGAGLRIVGEERDDGLGERVDSAGDFNSDGFEDIIFSGENSGKAYVFFGGGDTAGRIPANRIAADGLGVAITGLTGPISVAGAGDIDGDDYDDVIVGDESQGKAWIVFGSKGFRRYYHVNVLNFDGCTIEGKSVNKFGAAVDGAGDFDRDGDPDVIVGAPDTILQIAPIEFRAGAAFVVYGCRRGRVIDAENPESGQLTKLIGRHDIFTNPADQAGYSVAGVGNVEGDSRVEVLIGAPFSRFEMGAVYILSGESGRPSTIDLEDRDVIGAIPDYYLGYSLNQAGDVNADGRNDVLIGAPNPYIDGDPEAFVLYGGEKIARSLSDLKRSEGVNIIGDVYEQTGHAVGPLGDLDNNGYDDAGIGAPSFSWKSRPVSGGAWIFWGPNEQPTHELFTPYYELLPEIDVIGGGNALDEAGTAVTSARLNGSQPSVVVGTPGYDDPRGVPFGNHGAVLVISHCSNWWKQSRGGEGGPTSPCKVDGMPSRL